MDYIGPPRRPGPLPPGESGGMRSTSEAGRKSGGQEAVAYLPGRSHDTPGAASTASQPAASASPFPMVVPPSPCR